MTDPATVAVAAERPTLLPVLTAVVRGRWGSSLFGIVAPGAVRRHPSDVVRVLVTAVLLAGVAVWAEGTGPLEQALVAVIGALPGGLAGLFRVLYGVGPAVAVVLVVAALLAHRLRLLFSLTVAGGLAWAASAALSAVVAAPDVGRTTGRLADVAPDFPVVPLAAAGAVIVAARPFVTRPARRLMEAAYWLTAFSALYLVEGLLSGVAASLILAWGVGALVHLAFGSPGGMPDPAQVEASLADLGVTAEGLTLDPEQVWGHTTLRGTIGGRAASVEVVGRDSTDARLFRKLWRFVWYKDSGPVLTLRRSAQVEHQALVLLLAARTEARVPHLAAVGVAGSRSDALLVVHDPPGRLLADLGRDEVTDAVLADAWAALGALHRSGLAHGNLTSRRIVVDEAGRVGLIRFDRAEASAPPDHRALDAVQLLVATGELVGAERAVAAGRRALGDEELLTLVAYLEPAAVTGRSRSGISDLKGLVGALRTAATEALGVEPPPTAELRRFSAGKVLLAAAFALGVYLLVAQLAGVAAMGDVFAGAIWGWVALTFLLAQFPPPAQAVAMTGSVSASLPLRPVAMVQYAQSFTGLVGGTAGNATLSIRFFQKQGLEPAVAVSSGVLNSLAGFVVQFVLVVVGLAVTGTAFEGPDTGDGLPSWVVPVVVVTVLVGLGVLVVPGLRRRVAGIAARQLRAAYDNIREIFSMPRKAVALFGGNLASQLFFAMVLGAALHAYGESLPVLQLVVINSLASLIGGAVPVPGGMGVVETGLITGFTATGIPEAEAVAATFTARMCTAYLPPIWGWAAFQWLRRNEYV